MTSTSECACGQHTTSTGPSPTAEKHFDLASIPSPFLTREQAQRSLRQDFHRVDLQRFERQARLVVWERDYTRELRIGEGPPVILALHALNGQTVVPKSVSDWVKSHPRP